MTKNLSYLLKEERYPFYFWMLVILRGIFNFSLPLMDKTEARYGEIARIMAETSNWVVPQIDYGIPFWAKPPLSTWASALSISLFGTHAFFVRLPYLLLAIGIGLFLSRYKKDNSFYLPGIVLLCLPEFYLHAGVVSTDLFLSVSVGVMMLSFWEALQEQSKKYWGYLFFIGLGLGLLAKGPIIILLTLPPIGLWCLLTHNIRKALEKAPWVGGLLLCIGLAFPWYLLAENQSPGFWNYFFVGEHFERYLNSGWQGDKYGFPKQQPLGIVWVFLLLFLLPWSVLLIRLIYKKWTLLRMDSWALFLLLWMLWTPVFFTASKSLIHPYILPCTIPASLFIVHFWKGLKAKNIYLTISLLLPVLLLFVLLSGWAKPLYENKTDQQLVISVNSSLPIYSLDHKTYSSQFYTQGKIKQINQKELQQKIGGTASSFAIRIASKRWEELPKEIQSKLILVKKHEKGGMYVFEGKKY